MKRTNQYKALLLALSVVSFQFVQANDEQAVETESQISSTESDEASNEASNEAPTDNIVVTVTAQKRAKSLVDVPIAMSVIGGDNLERSSVTDIFSLDTMVPALNLTQAANSFNTVASLRGIGTSSFNPGLEPSVGIYVDGVFRATTGNAIGDFLSLDRVEVLRGPQSTLFGKNSSAGVISFVTMEPEFDTSGAISATIGNFNQKIIKATVTGPLSDTVAYRFSANFNSRDGYIDNLFDGSNINQRDRSSFRGQILIKPSEDVSIRIIADYSKIDELCCAAPFYFNGPTQGAIAAIGGTVLGGFGQVESFFDREVNFNGDVTNDLADKGISAEVNIDYDTFAFTSITAYRAFETFTSLDADFTDLVIVKDNDATADQTSFTQEFRFTSESTGNVGDVDWMFGAFFSNLDLETAGRATYGAHTRPYFDILGGSGLGALFGLPPSLGNLAILELLTGNPLGSFFAEDTGQVSEQFVTNSKSSAFFAQFDWKLSEETTVTAGLRYTKEDKTVTGVFDVQDPLAAIDFTTLFGGALIGFQGLQIFPPLQDFDRERSENQMTGNVMLTHSLNDDVNVYMSYSKGYKAGGFNVSRAASNNDANSSNQFEFDPEIVTAFELGTKMRFWNGQGMLDIALYNQEIKDFQTSVFNGIGFELDNAGVISVKGIEVDSRFVVTDNLNVSFGFAYNDAVFDTFIGGPCLATDPAPSCDLSGKTLGDAPKLTVSTSADYFVDLSDDLLGFIHGEVYYRGERNVGGALTDLTIQESTALVNLSIGVRGDDWEVFLWSRNLTNEDYVQTIFDSVAQAGSLNAYPNPPRTVGVTLKLDF